MMATPESELIYSFQNTNQKGKGKGKGKEIPQMGKAYVSSLDFSSMIGSSIPKFCNVFFYHI